MAGFDFKTVAVNDRGLLISGFVVLIASFLPFVGMSFGGFGSASVSAWSADFAVLGLLLLFAAAVVAGLRVFGVAQLPALSVSGGWPMIIAGASGLGALLVILRALTASYVSVQWGGYVLLLAALAQTAFAVLELKKQR